MMRGIERTVEAVCDRDLGDENDAPLPCHITVENVITISGGEEQRKAPAEVPKQVIDLSQASSTPPEKAAPLELSPLCKKPGCICHSHSKFCCGSCKGGPDARLVTDRYEENRA